MIHIKYTSDGSGQMFCSMKRKNARTTWNTEPYKRHAACIQAIIGLLKDTGGDSVEVRDHVKGFRYFLTKGNVRKFEKKLDHRSKR